jgi:hypothetical protein
VSICDTKPQLAKEKYPAQHHEDYQLGEGLLLIDPMQFFILVE